MKELDVTALFLEKGAHFDTRDRRVGTAFHLAVQLTHIDSTKIPLDSGAKGRAYSRFGNTAQPRVEADSALNEKTTACMGLAIDVGAIAEPASF